MSQQQSADGERSSVPGRVSRSGRRSEGHHARWHRTRAQLGRVRALKPVRRRDVVVTQAAGKVPPSRMPPVWPSHTRRCSRLFPFLPSFCQQPPRTGWRGMLFGVAWFRHGAGVAVGCNRRWVARRRAAFRARPRRTHVYNVMSYVGRMLCSTAAKVKPVADLRVSSCSTECRDDEMRDWSIEIREIGGAKRMPSER